MSEPRQARRYFVSGRVQGVGYRNFVQLAAEKLQMTGYVRNLEDGRVEVLAVGATEQHVLFREVLELGPMFAIIREVREAPAIIEPGYESGFVIGHSS